MMNDIGKAFDAALSLMLSIMAILLVLAPFGIWKIVEIIIWICNHTNISWESKP